MTQQGRRSIRLKDYDYSQDSAYFVTLLAHKRQHLFGEITDGEVTLSTLGCVVLEEWERTAILRPYIEIDLFVVMPNHLHGIAFFNQENQQGDGIGRGAQRCALTHGSTELHRQPHSLGSLIAGFKSSATTRINQTRQTPGQRVWQRNYYERIIRNERALNAIREYIYYNPARWSKDEYYSESNSR